MRKYSSRVQLFLTTGLALAAISIPSLAAAQAAADAQEVTEVIVTGSSIRGAPAVGSNLISVGRQDIEQTSVQTVQQLLKTVPAVTGLGSAGQGGFGSFDAAGTNAPTIHGLGGVSSNSTLIVIDGHRFPLSGVIRSLGDPNIVPPNAIERVEVVPEGASSVYGSDAVAGVINFVTRRRFSGIEATAQTGFGDNYRTYSAGVAAGKTWEQGFGFLAYSYSDRDAVASRNRPFTNPNKLALGGTNFANFNCSPATFQPTGSSSLYAYPYATAGSSAQAAAMCDTTGVADLIPAEKRHSVMLKFEQGIGEKLLFNVDAVYSTRTNVQQISRGSITARVFGPGSANAGQINPFYVFPTGSTATSGTVRLNFDELLGPGATTEGKSEAYYLSSGLKYKLGGDWSISGLAMFGVNTSSATNYDALCASCALLALNGTTNTNGVLTQVSIPGTTTTVLSLPLTTANALDPFRPAASNRTSPATLAGLIDHASWQRARQDIQQYQVKIDGSLLELPAGAVKVAVGAEYTNYGALPSLSQTLNIGPITSGARSLNLEYDRDVKSAFGELLLPLVSPDMEIPLVNKLNVNFSARYDKYSDFGSTKNPKIAVDWEVVEGIKLRGNVARSFVAPPIGTIGKDGMALDTNIGAFAQGQFAVPLDRYPEARLVPGCATAVTVCNFGTAAITGMIINGANPDLVAQKGRTWSIGVDFAQLFVPGLRGSITYWHNGFTGGVTSPIPSLALNSTGFNQLLTIYPNGATQAQIDAFRSYRPQSSILQPPIYFSYDFRNQNALNLKVEGIDADVRYRHTFDWGSFNGGVAATYKTRFDQQVGAGSPVFSVLNRNRFNSTFPSVQFDLRADAGVDIGPASASLYLNHTGAYTYWGANAINPVTTTNGSPTGGGDHMKAYTTFDFNFGYDLSEVLPGKTRLVFDVTNLFDKKPPFQNVSEGYDNFVANPIGRVVTVGIRTKF